MKGKFGLQTQSTNPIAVGDIKRYEEYQIRTIHHIHERNYIVRKS
jgi:hypothetical protein